MKAMIVDDEAPARSELKFLLDELGQTEVVAEAASVREAIEKLKEYPVDVMCPRLRDCSWRRPCSISSSPLRSCS